MRTEKQTSESVAVQIATLKQTVAALQRDVPLIVTAEFLQETLRELCVTGGALSHLIHSQADRLPRVAAHHRR